MTDLTKTTPDHDLMDELREVDRLLPGLAEEPPPPELVAKVLDRVTAETARDAASPAPPRRRTPRPPVWLAAAALLLGAGVTFAMMSLGRQEGPFTPAASRIDSVDSTTAKAPATDYDQQAEQQIIRERIRSQLEEQRAEAMAEAMPAEAATERYRYNPVGKRDPYRGPPAQMAVNNAPGYHEQPLRDPNLVPTAAEATPVPRSRDGRDVGARVAFGETDAPEEIPGWNREQYAHVADNPWMRTDDDPLSTFSIDVDTASYSNVRRILRDGGAPPASAVRIEELLNYFDYDYPVPDLDADPPFTVTAQVGPAPWAPEHRLVHVGLQAAEMPADEIPARNLVFLIDVSGSMSSADKLPLLKTGLSMLARSLRPEDTVAIVVYAGAAGVVLPPTSGVEADRIDDALSRLKAGGSTHGAAGIRLAYDLAREHFVEDGVNRVLLATDGDFNVGTSSQGELVELIEQERQTGVFLTVLGFGRGNLADDRMEALADHGNGNYAYIDSVAEAHRVLVDDASATLVTVAKDVKIQVEFNPAEVAGYRLIGYANRQLEHRDFKDDSKDAGEVGAGHSVTALYEVIPAGGTVPVPEGTELRYQQPTEPSPAADSGELLTVRLRWKDPQGSKSRQAGFPVTDGGSDLETTSDDFRFSAAVAGWGMLLRGSSHVGVWSTRDASRLADGARGDDRGGWRRELVELIELSGR